MIIVIIVKIITIVIIIIITATTTNFHYLLFSSNFIGFITKANFNLFNYTILITIPNSLTD
jgi:hypothetical protein